jgi:hypothetical protein
MTDRCFAGYCGSWTLAFRGEIYQRRRRSLGPIARSMVGTANGAMKGLGLGKSKLLAGDGAMNRNKIEVAL